MTRDLNCNVTVLRLQVYDFTPWAGCNLPHYVRLPNSSANYHNRNCSNPMRFFIGLVNACSELREHNECDAVVVKEFLGFETATTVEYL
jgi:hypothetical protein